MAEVKEKKTRKPRPTIKDMLLARKNLLLKKAEDLKAKHTKYAEEVATLDKAISVL